MKAKELDNKFDRGEDITVALDLSKARRVNQKATRVNVDFPAWMVQSLDKEATRVGVTRQSSSSCGSPNGSNRKAAVELSRASFACTR
jgi:hypothetical protein